MSIPAAGEFGTLGRIINGSLMSTLDIAHREPKREQIAEASLILDLEYRSSGVDLDSVWIAEKVKKYINQKRLNNFALYVPLVKHITDQENPNYNAPPQRIFRNAKGDVIKSKSILNRIEEIYEQMDMDDNMLTISHQAAYMGTVMCMPMVDPNTNWMNILKLTPDLKTLEIRENEYNRSRADAIAYSVEDKENNGTITYEWNLTDKITTKNIGGIESKATESHGFVDEAGMSGMPFAVLRYITDTNRFWGAYDGGLLSLVKTRSLLLADTIHRTQTSLFEILTFAGFSPDEAIAALETIDKGVIAFEHDKKSDGTVDSGSKEISYTSPEGLSPELLIETWLKLYNHFLKARGHTQKNFDTSNLVVSAESMRLANKGLLEMRNRRRKNLTQFEQTFFKRVIWENNKSKNPKIPLDTMLHIDWQPDDTGFDSAGDKATYYDTVLKHNLKTAPDIIRLENPELSAEASLEKFLENEKFNEEHKTVITIGDFNNNDNNESDDKNLPPKPDDKPDGKI